MSKTPIIENSISVSLVLIKKQPNKSCNRVHVSSSDIFHAVPARLLRIHVSKCSEYRTHFAIDMLVAVDPGYMQSVPYKWRTMTNIDC